MKKISVLEKKLNASAFAFVAILSAASYSSAQASGSSSNYVGVDGVYSSMKFREYYGDNIFNKKGIPGVNLFAGHMFNENWGFEAGYEVDKKMKRDNVRVNSGQTVAGNVVPSLYGFADYNTKLKQHHTYLGFLAKYNLKHNLFASLMLGSSLSHVHAEYNLFNVNVANAHIDITRSFSKTKLIPIIRAALEYKINDKIGLRALTTWKKTSKFKIIAEQPFVGSPSEVKLKNTINIGAGVSYYI